MRGERRSHRKGQSVEFADFRNYVAGDDLRFIDWNLYAWLDRLYLKLFLEEEDLHFFAIIDDSPSMSFGAPSKFFAAKQIAACLSYIGLCHGDRVSVSTFSTAHNPLVIRGKSSTHRLLGMLEEAECLRPYSQSKVADFSGSPTSDHSTEAPLNRLRMHDAIKTFCLRTRGKGIAVIISDLMEKEGFESALRMLVARDMDVFVVHILSPEELSPVLQGDLKLVDCEDGSVREISISSAVMDQYHKTLKNFLERVKGFCNRMSVTYIPATSDQAVDVLVTDYMRARGLVR